MISLQLTGLSHSEIRGSKVICTYPQLIAAYHVLHRLLEPRHPPFALICFFYFFCSCKIVFLYLLISYTSVETDAYEFFFYYFFLSIQYVKDRFSPRSFSTSFGKNGDLSSFKTLNHCQVLSFPTAKDTKLH